VLVAAAISSLLCVLDFSLSASLSRRIGYALDEGLFCEYRGISEMFAPLTPSGCHMLAVRPAVDCRKQRAAVSAAPPAPQQHALQEQHFNCPHHLLSLTWNAPRRRGSSRRAPFSPLQAFASPAHRHSYARLGCPQDVTSFTRGQYGEGSLSACTPMIFTSCGAIRFAGPSADPANHAVIAHLAKDRAGLGKLSIECSAPVWYAGPAGISLSVASFRKCTP